MEPGSPQTSEKYFQDEGKKPKEVYQEVVSRAQYMSGGFQYRVKRLEKCLAMANEANNPVLAGQLEALIAVEGEGRVFTDVTEGRYLRFFKKGSG